MENTLNQTAETTAEVVEVKSSSLSQEFAAQLLESASVLDKAEVAVQVNSVYMEFAKVGEKTRGIFIDFTEATFKDKENEGEYKKNKAVRWMGSDRKVYISAGTALVNEIERANIQPGTAIEIEYASKKENTKIYNVSILALPKKA